jgi:hypothetical protein
MKIDDFKKEGVSDKVAQMRHKFHRENRIKKLTQLGGIIQAEQV